MNKQKQEIIRYKFPFGNGYLISNEIEFEATKNLKGYFMVAKEPYDCTNVYESNLYEIGEKITCEQNTFEGLCSAFFDYCQKYLLSISPNDFIGLFLKAGTHITDNAYNDYEFGLTQGISGINYSEMRCELKVDLPPYNYVSLCLLFIEKEAIEIGKLSNELIEVEYDDNSKEILNVTSIQTRKEAIELCNKFTKEALKKDNAFEYLNIFKNNFDRCRNYEIETYLEKITGNLTYRIVEKCPFNNFSWFDS